MWKDSKECSEAFVQLVNNTKNHDILTHELKQGFWLAENAWIIESIPWSELQQAKLKLVQVKQIDEVYGMIFCTLEAYSNNVISFSLLKGKDGWKIAWQNREVYKALTKNWASLYFENIEIRFFDSFTFEERNHIARSIKKIQEWLSQQYLVSQEKLIIIFGLNLYEFQVCDIPNPDINPRAFGGDSRGKLISIMNNHVDFSAGNPFTLLCESIMLHEICHEYTIYDKAWNGSKDKPSITYSLLMEGIAYYYQYNYLIKALQDEKLDVDKVFFDRHVSGFLAAKEHLDKTTELINNQLFITYDRTIPQVSHLSYVLAATLYDYLLHRFGFDKSKEIILKAAALNEYEAKDYLNSKINDKEYFQRAQVYLDEVIHGFKFRINE